MVRFKIEFKASVKKDLRAIPAAEVARLLSAIENLATNPYPDGARKLAGREAWRLRLGHYRIIYQVENQRITIVIVKIGHRRAVYR